MTIDPNATLGELLLERPELAEPFERLGLDYCCRGGRSLAAACAERGLDVDTLARALDAAAAPAEEHFDCRSASIASLCDHIVAEHHDRVRREAPRLAETLGTVVRVHGDDDPRLATLARVFDSLARELLDHVEREERLLFPACRALDAGEAGGESLDGRSLLAELEHDHADVGETLAVLRDLADGYRPDAARCSTHRSLLAGLDALERDLHRHIHEENNVLFPRVRALATA